MVALTIYVEGGGQTNDLRTECRAAFRRLLESAGHGGSMPRIFASGSRAQAYDDFCTALSQGKKALLLVDSEDAPSSPDDPWAHVAARPTDTWTPPAGARAADLHFMVRSTEAWLLADQAAAAAYFGNGFNAKALPRRPVEEVSRADSVAAFEKAAKATKKQGYRKGRDTFALLGTIDPAKVRGASPWAERFFTEVAHRVSTG